MAKKRATRRLPDMSKYKSPFTPKGVQYLEGEEKADLFARMKRAFRKAKIKQVA